MKKGDNLVSVIVPIYNTEKYLRECLNSILVQSYCHLEIILINDGSLDNSGVIADEYARMDARVKVIQKQNEGASITKNLGIANATGKYITFIDADDFIRTDFIENLLNDMTKYQVAVTTTTKMCPIDKENSENVEVYSQGETLEKMFYGTLEKSQNGVQMFERQLLIDNTIFINTFCKFSETIKF